jgi:hypothetical protein
VNKLYTILFKVPELKRKILFTALFLAIYRIGFYIPLPIVDQEKLRSWQDVQQQSAAGKVFGTVAMFGGTSIGMSTIFGLGIMPYISASINFQLLGSIVPALEAMMKEADQRIHPLRHRLALRNPKRLLGAIHDEPPDGGRLTAVSDVLARVRQCLHDDGRHHLPDVGRRADRRVRHRQRHQPPHHGGGAA